MRRGSLPFLYFSKLLTQCASLKLSTTKITQRSSSLMLCLKRQCHTLLPVDGWRYEIAKGKTPKLVRHSMSYLICWSHSSIGFCRLHMNRNINLCLNVHLKLHLEWIQWDGHEIEPHLEHTAHIKNRRIHQKLNCPLLSGKGTLAADDCSKIQWHTWPTSLFFRKKKACPFYSY